MLINQDLAFNKLQELFPSVTEAFFSEIFDSLFGFDDSLPSEEMVRKISEILKQGGRNAIIFRR